MTAREIRDYLQRHAQRVAHLVNKGDLPEGGEGHWYLVGQIQAIAARVAADLDLLAAEHDLLAAEHELCDPVKRGPGRLVGIDSVVEIEPGKQFALQVLPQEVFRAERLCIPKSVGHAFSIDDIIGGNQSQFTTGTPISADLFDSNLTERNAARIARANKGRGVPTADEPAIESLLADPDEGREIDMKANKVGIPIWLRVTNRDVHRHRFRGLFVGFTR